MKLTSLTSVIRALWGGRTFSSVRAAWRPPKPPPAITTCHAMRSDAARKRRRAGARLGGPAQYEGQPAVGLQPPLLAQAVRGHRGGDLVALVGEQPGGDERLRWRLEAQCE